MRLDRLADVPPYHVTEGATPSRWLVTCDHATNRIPPEIGGGDLGIAAGDMARHIAYDIGALGVARGLAERLGAPLVASNFSRLVIDPNRGEHDPTLIMRLYDGTVIPANRNVDADERRRRLEAYWRPYDTAIASLASRRPDTAIVAVHSYTPQLRNRAPRPWHVGVLYPSATPRLGLALIATLRAETDLIVGVNQPYPGDLPGDTVDRHGRADRREAVLIEVRNDLIDTPEREAHWVGRLAPALRTALAAVDA